MIKKYKNLRLNKHIQSLQEEEYERRYRVDLKLE